MDFLSSKGYSAAKIIKTKNHKNYVKASTPWGDYLAVVFKGVGGKQISNIPYSDELYFGYENHWENCIV